MLLYALPCFLFLAFSCTPSTSSCSIPPQPFPASLHPLLILLYTAKVLTPDLMLTRPQTSPLPRNDRHSLPSSSRFSLLNMASALLTWTVGISYIMAALAPTTPTVLFPPSIKNGPLRIHSAYRRDKRAALLLHSLHRFGLANSYSVVDLHDTLACV